MECPNCKAETEVIETRLASSGGVRRRRRCTACVVRGSGLPYTFATVELLRDDVTAMRAAAQAVAQMMAIVDVGSGLAALEAIVAFLRSVEPAPPTRPADLDVSLPT